MKLSRYCAELHKLALYLRGRDVQRHCRCASHFVQMLRNIASLLTGIQLEAHKGHRRQKRLYLCRRVEVIEIKFCISKEVARFDGADLLSGRQYPRIGYSLIFHSNNNDRSFPMEYLT